MFWILETAVHILMFWILETAVYVYIRAFYAKYQLIKAKNLGV